MSSDPLPLLNQPEFKEVGDHLEAQHKWIDISIAGSPPEAICGRCGKRLPIKCALDSNDAP